MKKSVFYLFIIGLLLVIPVKAKENKVYIYEKDNKLYYDGEFASENLFMKHKNIMPGESFTDLLTIENGTDKTFTVYFNLEESNKGEAKELLNYISMEIELDGEIIYNGKVDGLDYDSSGVNLQNKVKLREFSYKDSSLMKVKTTLSPNYDNYQNFETSTINWHFYAETDDIEDEPEEIPYNPKTGDNIVIFLILLAIAISVYVFFMYKERKEMKK